MAEKRGQAKQFLSAQVYAAPFYERLGFAGKAGEIWLTLEGVALEALA